METGVEVLVGAAVVVEVPVEVREVVAVPADDVEAGAAVRVQWRLNWELLW